MPYLAATSIETRQFARALDAVARCLQAVDLVEYTAVAEMRGLGFGP